MKANEAPEKIYVDSKAIGDDISTTVHTKRQDYPTCTEYTRTDAFIENTCEWLKENFSFDEAGYCKTNIYSTESMIYYFKKYIGISYEKGN